MTMDLLDYELKYKRDPHIMELIDQFKTMEEMEKVSDNSDYEKTEEIRSLKERVSDLEDEVERKNSGLRQSISELEAIRSFKKADMIEAINEITNEMEGLTDD